MFRGVRRRPRSRSQALTSAPVEWTRRSACSNNSPKPSEDPDVLLALCDLYADAEGWDEIVDAAAGAKNEDDLTLQLRLYQARALREQGMNDAALEAYKDALRSKKRDPDLLNEARYERGKLLLEKGKRAQAMRDLQTVYADDPTYEDVADLVSRPTSAPL